MSILVCAPWASGEAGKLDLVDRFQAVDEKLSRFFQQIEPRKTEGASLEPDRKSFLWKTTKEKERERDERRFDVK